MTWVKLDDSFATHPKVGGLSDGAFRLEVAALCYAASQLTDGEIHRKVLHLVGVEGSQRRLTKLAAELVNAGRWEATHDGWLIHDYLVYQEERAKVLDRRVKTAERVRRHRGVTSGVGNDVTEGVGNAGCTPPPGPDPSRKELLLTSSVESQDAPRLASDDDGAEPTGPDPDAHDQPPDDDRIEAAARILAWADAGTHDDIRDHDAWVTGRAHSIALRHGPRWRQALQDRPDATATELADHIDPGPTQQPPAATNGRAPEPRPGEMYQALDAARIARDQAAAEADKAIGMPPIETVHRLVGTTKPTLAGNPNPSPHQTEEEAK